MFSPAAHICRYLSGKKEPHDFSYAPGNIPVGAIVQSGFCASITNMAGATFANVRSLVHLCQCSSESEWRTPPLKIREPWLIFIPVIHRP